ncbi:MAG: hypothetical protein AAB568_04085 [Patescibacteria group bacterium]
MIKNGYNLMRDLAIIIFSIIIAVILVKTRYLATILTSTREMEFLGSFVAGIFFTSIFTAVPATVTLGEIAQNNTVGWTAFFGGLGALVGDLIIFRFVKDSFSEHIITAFENIRQKKILLIFHKEKRHIGWMLKILGAIIVASPLPDEIGLTLLGFSKIKMIYFVPLSFFLNSLGILIIGLIAKSLIS